MDYLRLLDENLASRTRRRPRYPNLAGPCFASTGYLVFWLLLFLAVVVPLFFRTPNSKTVEDASKGIFIAERAMDNLQKLVQIGPKVVGSDNNENKTVQFLLDELNIIEKSVLKEYFDIEVDLQQVSGSYIHWTMVNQYQGVQNVVVKLSPKNCSSETYLLVNSHFDSKATSPAAGDAGQMVAIMLEVLRVMSTTRQTFTHPIIFLLNGAEENPLQGSHGFITQHKWAPFCKVFLNLEGVGGGGRELLFQTGPNQPWLVDYYKKNVDHPFATTLVEELFQSGLLPSEMDFEIFIKYGNIVGLDLAQVINGYTYHTKYDNYSVIPSDSVQSMGENVLCLVRALSNAPELQNTASLAKEPSVYFDFLGLFFVSYSHSIGVLLNLCVVGATFVLIFISLALMARVSQERTTHMLCRFMPVLIIQAFSVGLGLGLPLLIAYYFDKGGLSLTYYSTGELIFGLYVCPCLLGYFLPSFLLLVLPNIGNVFFRQHLQMTLHALAVILALLVVGLTAYGLRSTYVVTWTLIFYLLSLALNLVTRLHNAGVKYTGFLVFFQLFSFLYNSYLLYTLLKILVSMMGRMGRSTNPDLVIAALTALGTILAMGFLITITTMFERRGLVLVILLTLSGLSILAATCTHLGFPYRPRTNVERVPYLHVRRTFYDYNGSVSKDDSGYLFNFQDRRGPVPLEGTSVNLTGLVGIAPQCEEHMMCDQPLFDHRWVKNRLNAMWLPREELIEPPLVPKVELISKVVLEGNNTVRFNFTVHVTDHTSLFIQPFEYVNITNWTFPIAYLGTQTTYHVYFCHGHD